ncbi:MAG TPA: polysaccharide deacetylase family protein, partial [Cyclobacteriaceae bacterium]|nr:polysaccharide deacetylase family protein [Cyclobacteriaceae bacterium]
MKNLLYFIALNMIVSCTGKSSAEIKSANPDKTVVCFIYHRFGDSRFPSTNVSIEDFEKHLKYLSENNFQVLSLSDAIKYLQSDTPLKKTVVLTIDDGYKTFYSNALPLLKKYHIPATLFINTQTVGGNDYMTWSQLKEARDAQIEIGNHTHSHAYFLNEPPTTRYASFESEIKQSQEIIHKNLDLTPVVFAYPYGEFDERMKNIVSENGFTCAAAQNSGVLFPATDLFQIPRFPMADTYADPKRFAEKATTRPLKIITELPTATLLADDVLQPELTLTFGAENLEVSRMQCFIQGDTCV